MKELIGYIKKIEKIDRTTAKSISKTGRLTIEADDDKVVVTFANQSDVFGYQQGDEIRVTLSQANRTLDEKYDEDDDDEEDDDGDDDE